MFSLVSDKTIESARIMRRMGARSKVAARHSVFRREPAPDSIRGGSRFAAENASNAKPLWHIGNAGKLSRRFGPASTPKCLQRDHALIRITAGSIDHAHAAAGDA